MIVIVLKAVEDDLVSLFDVLCDLAELVFGIGAGVGATTAFHTLLDATEPVPLVTVSPGHFFFLPFGSHRGLHLVEEEVLVSVHG